MELLEQEEVAPPKLRFKVLDGGGLSGTYRRYLLGDLCQFSLGRSIKQGEASPDFAIPCVRYGELYHMYGEVIDEVVNRTDLDPSELLFSHGDEILLPSAGEDPMDIGNASALMLKGVAIGRTINILRPLRHDTYDHRYVAYYIREKLRETIAALAQGVSISNVYNTQLRTLEIKLPTLPEQQKIAAFLGAVDRKIQQLKRKQALLEQYKKGVVQQLFSQELRFKREEGGEYPEWEEKRLGEILTIGSGRDYKHLGKGDVPVFGTGGYMLSVNEALYDGETVFIGRKGTIDKPFYFKGKFWTVDTLFYTHQYRGVIPQFVLALFQRINWREHNEASGVPSLSKTTIEKITVELPSLEEQARIAGFLMALDAKVAGVAQAVAAAEKWKKGLLQQMFV
jgi:type I restriction enzyme S subunit